MHRILSILIASAIVVTFASASAEAGVCDYRPSALIGGTGTGAVIAGSGGVAVAGAGAKALGVYTLTNATTGMTMLGSTAAGTSAAGTVGIIGGTSGVIGTVGAIVTSPAVLVGAAVVAVGTGSLEGICYFGDERITDYQEIDAILRSMNTHADARYFHYWPGNGRDNGEIMLKPDQKGHWQTYTIENLYIVNGTLKSRDWGLNTVIGNVGLIAAK